MDDITRTTDRNGTAQNGKLEVALSYLARGWLPVRVNGKVPIGIAWQLQTPTTLDVTKWFRKRNRLNVGVLLGEPSGWLVDVDLDHPLAVELGDQFIPETPAVFGRPGKVRSHRLFVAMGAATHQRELSSGMLVELRSTGGQTVFPGSTHVSGEPIEWVSEGEPTVIDAAFLTACVDDLADEVERRLGIEPRTQSESNHPAGPATEDDVERARDALKAIPAQYADAYGSWFRIGMALKSVSDSLLPAWDNWSRSSEKYRDGETARKWESFNGSGVGPGTLFHLAIANGWNPPRRTQNTGERAAQLSDIAYAHGQTDAAHATRFVDEHHAELLYVAPWKKWLSWDGSRWSDDAGVGVLQRAKRYGDALWRHLATIARHVDRDDLGKVVTAIKAANQSPKIKSYLELAAVDERVVCRVDELNADPTLLNVANGTIDLTTGTLRPHNPADRITQLAGVVYDPAAVCPRWLDTLGLIFDGDAELMRYVQRLLGYSLSGDTGEHILPIAFGKGCNGKSTIWNTIAELLGEYATLANDELLLGDKSNHPTEKAALYQKRFVAISEPEKDSGLRESRVKELTGDRMITARRMKEDFWTFERTHTFWLSTNHLPHIDGTDEGIWRRVKLIPFNVDLRDKVEPIPDYDRWLIAHEGPGILAWLVRGYLDYREHGLDEPATVTAATGRYRADSDPLGDFLDEHCIIESGAEAVASELFRAYSDRHKGRWSATAFGRAMSERHQKSKSTSGANRNKTVYRGVRLRGDDEPDPKTGDSSETPQKQELRRVAPGSSTPPRNLANSIGDHSDPAQPGAHGDCNHIDPSTWLHRDGSAFCRGCNRFMGRLPTPCDQRQPFFGTSGNLEQRIHDTSP